MIDDRTDYEVIIALLERLVGLAERFLEHVDLEEARREATEKIMRELYPPKDAQ